MPEAPPVGFVVLSSDDPPQRIVARLGEETPELSGGIGGWEEVARPRRSTVTTWTGQPARRLTLPLLLDGFLTDTSVEGDIARLERLALPRSGGQPPSLRVLARGNHVPYQQLRWVIESLTWGDAIMDVSGNRVRQAVAVALLQFIPDELIEAKKRRSPAQRRRALHNSKTEKNRFKNAQQKRKAAARSRQAVARAQARAHKQGRAVTATATFDGEDLMTIAARELGDAQRWREIAALNNMRDPRAVHVGQVLRLP